MAAGLQTRYSEPQRHYHTLEHISYMLNALGSGGPIHELAIWFHDCIYDPVKGGPWNETQSIRVWEEFCDLTNSQAMGILKSPVSTLIEATISHRLPEMLPEGLSSFDVALFLDLDMRILADSPSVYAKYADEIRAEYSHYPAEAYRSGRAELLQNFLSHERIFLGRDTEAMEQRARKNIQSEIDSLLPSGK
ncbi:hypothetical protein C8R43DRAFT_13798 [Mycena crocata]|nr:hypothetical protein C8R43DRAFT_13798 [Mycena crocata]